jgi:hypothetical protein
MDGYVKGETHIIVVHLVWMFRSQSFCFFLLETWQGREGKRTRRSNVRVMLPLRLSGQFNANLRWKVLVISLCIWIDTFCPWYPSHRMPLVRLWRCSPATQEVWGQVETASQMDQREFDLYICIEVNFFWQKGSWTLQWHTFNILSATLYTDIEAIATTFRVKWGMTCLCRYDINAIDLLLTKVITRFL